MVRETCSCVNSGTAPRPYRDVAVKRPVGGTVRWARLAGHLALLPSRNR
jgi:hypothetical protein